jgi:hypothetical protein
LPKLNSRPPPSKGSYECEINGTGKVLNVTECGTKIKDGKQVRVARDYVTNLPTGQTPDDVHRLLHSTLTLPNSPSDLYNMLIASQDANSFQKLINNELKSMQVEDDPFNNDYLWFVFMQYPTRDKLTNALKTFKIQPQVGPPPQALGIEHIANNPSTLQRGAQHCNGTDNTKAGKRKYTFDVAATGAVTHNQMTAAEFVKHCMDSGEAGWTNARDWFLKHHAKRMENHSKERAIECLQQFNHRLATEKGQGLNADLRGELLAMKVLTTMMSSDYEMKYGCASGSGVTGIDQIWGRRGGMASSTNTS